MAEDLWFSAATPTAFSATGTQDEGAVWPCSGRWIALEVSSIACFVSLERSKALLHSFITTNLHSSDFFGGPVDGGAGWKSGAIWKLMLKDPFEDRWCWAWSFPVLLELQEKDCESWVGLAQVSRRADYCLWSSCRNIRAETVEKVLLGSKNLMTWVQSLLHT